VRRTGSAASMPMWQMERLTIRAFPLACMAITPMAPDPRGRCGSGDASGRRHLSQGPRADVSLQSLGVSSTERVNRSFPSSSPRKFMGELADAARRGRPTYSAGAVGGLEAPVPGQCHAPPNSSLEASSRSTTRDPPRPTWGWRMLLREKCKQPPAPGRQGRGPLIDYSP